MTSFLNVCAEVGLALTPFVLVAIVAYRMGRRAGRAEITAQVMIEALREASTWN